MENDDEYGDEDEEEEENEEEEERSWGLLGALGVLLGAYGGALEQSWGHPGAILGSFWPPGRLLVPSWRTSIKEELGP